MIVARPKTNTLFSISIFVAAAFALFVYGMTELRKPEASYMWFILVYSTGPIGLVVLIKVLLGWKIVRIGKDKLEINFPFKFSRKKLDGKEIMGWKKNTIKTFGGVYEEIICEFNSGDSFTLSRQEHTEFDKTLKYMSKKYKKQKV